MYSQHTGHICWNIFIIIDLEGVPIILLVCLSFNLPKCRWGGCARPNRMGTPERSANNCESVWIPFDAHVFWHANVIILRCTQAFLFWHKMTMPVETHKNIQTSHNNGTSLARARHSSHDKRCLLNQNIQLFIREFIVVNVMLLWAITSDANLWRFLSFPLITVERRLVGDVAAIPCLRLHMAVVSTRQSRRRSRSYSADCPVCPSPIAVACRMLWWNLSPTNDKTIRKLPPHHISQVNRCSICSACLSRPAINVDCHSECWMASTGWPSSCQRNMMITAKWFGPTANEMMSIARAHASRTPVASQNVSASWSVFFFFLWFDWKNGIFEFLEASSFCIEITCRHMEWGYFIFLSQNTF